MNLVKISLEFDTDAPPDSLMPCSICGGPLAYFDPPEGPIRCIIACPACIAKCALRSAPNPPKEAQ